MYRKDIIQGMQSIIDRNSNVLAYMESVPPLKKHLTQYRKEQTTLKRALGELMRAWK